MHLNQLPFLRTFPEVHQNSDSNTFRTLFCILACEIYFTILLSRISRSAASPLCLLFIKLPGFRLYGFMSFVAKSVRRRTLQSGPKKFCQTKMIKFCSVHLTLLIFGPLKMCGRSLSTMWRTKNQKVWTSCDVMSGNVESC